MARTGAGLARERAIWRPEVQILAKCNPVLARAFARRAAVVVVVATPTRMSAATAYAPPCTRCESDMRSVTVSLSATLSTLSLSARRKMLDIALSRSIPLFRDHRTVRVHVCVWARGRVRGQRRAKIKLRSGQRDNAETSTRALAIYSQSLVRLVSRLSRALPLSLFPPCLYPISILFPSLAGCVLVASAGDSPRDSRQRGCSRIAAGDPKREVCHAGIDRGEIVNISLKFWQA